MSSILFRLFLFTGICLLFSCKELYYPEIDPAPNVIAVEGLITDQPGPYIIKLSYTSVYPGKDTSEPVEDAIVTVTDENGLTYNFSQLSPGLYRSSYGWSATAGNTYTLEFETTEEDIYRSHPQTLLPAYEIEGLKADSSYRTSTRESTSGRLIITENKGIDATLEVKEDESNPANIRFKSDVKVLYLHESGPNFFFCWKALKGFEGLNNINLPAASNQPGDVNNNIAAFLPLDNKGYGLRDIHSVITRLIKISLFSINKDTYNYYLNINKQLTSDETIFAPVPSQIAGNIYCVNDESKLAVGLFEASSVTSRSYILRTPTRVPELLFEPSDVYDEIPPADCLENEIPPFWVNGF